MLRNQAPITVVATDRKIGDFTATLRALVDHLLLLLEFTELFYWGDFPICRENRAAGLLRQLMLPTGYPLLSA